MAVELRRCLGVLPTTGQALATVGLTITAVINIPAALAAGSGHATWICYAIALMAMLLVVETLVLFRRHPARADGIAGYVETGLGQGPSTLASWALFFGYGALFIGCLSYFATYLASLLQALGLTLPVLVLFALGGAAAWQLARRDVPLSATTMLVSETVSVLLVMALCGLVLLAGVVFLFWAVVLTEGLSWLPVSVRQGTDPLLALSDLLHWPLAGRLVELGAALSLFGTSLGSLTAMGRLGYVLAQVRMLPPALAVVDGRFATPARALNAAALPGLLLGAVLLLAGQTPQSLYDGFGGGAVLAFLLVYGLVAMAALQRPLIETVPWRRRWIAGACLLVCTVVLLSYGRTLLQAQPMPLVWSLLILTIGALLVQRTVRAG
jgi:amino acid transporter